MHDIVLAAILATAALTFLLRYVPLAVMHRASLPPRAARFLRTLPIGILAALVSQSLFLRNGVLDSGLSNYYLHGLAAVLAMAVLTRSIGAVVVGGLGVVALLTLLGAR